MTTPILRNVLIGQWQFAPRMTRIAGEVLQPILDDAVSAAARIQLMQHIDEAEGVWLDRLGARVGVERPSTTDPSMDTRWGFDSAGVGWNLLPFRGSVANAAVYPLPDAVFRRFVKARAVLVLGDGTIYKFTEAVLHIDPAATILDNRDMSVSITTSLQTLLELADESGALPRTAGVMVIYA